MKELAIGLILALTLAGCSQPPAADDGPPPFTAERALQVAQDPVETWSSTATVVFVGAREGNASGGADRVVLSDDGTPGDGVADRWTVLANDTERNASHSFVVGRDGVVDSGPSNTTLNRSLSPWSVDSDEAVQRLRQDNRSRSSLRRMTVDGATYALVTPPNRTAIWRLSLHGNGTGILGFVDARTGDVEAVFPL